jgi:hypothetical protein
MGLIDAYKAMKSIDEIACSMSVCINSDYCHGMTAMKDAAIHAIEQQPTVDAVPVRCGQCKYYSHDMNCCAYVNGLQNVTKTDYCSYGRCADGERRSE